jgi:ketosteroid isomerase-like protein
MTATQAVLERTYTAFNARDIDAVLAVMRPDVIWPNGMEGGTVVGHADDPVPRIVGCFDATARYPADRLALTYPVPC